MFISSRKLTVEYSVCTEIILHLILELYRFTSWILNKWGYYQALSLWLTLTSTSDDVDSLLKIICRLLFYLLSQCFSFGYYHFLPEILQCSLECLTSDVFFFDHVKAS